MAHQDLLPGSLSKIRRIGLAGSSDLCEGDAVVRKFVSGLAVLAASIRDAYMTDTARQSTALQILYR